MKLRNKKTGEIRNCQIIADDLFVINSIADLNEWEDYEEQCWYIDSTGEVIEGELDADWRDEQRIGNYFSTKEEAEKALEKLKAWKRLKDRGFEFCGYEALGCGEIHFTSDWDIEDEYEKGQRRKDLDLLLGGEDD